MNDFYGCLHDATKTTQPALSAKMHRDVSIASTSPGNTNIILSHIIHSRLRQSRPQRTMKVSRVKRSEIGKAAFLDHFVICYSEPTETNSSRFLK